MWSDTPCKIWTGNLSSEGYPVVQRSGKQFLLTRLILEEKQGYPIEPGYECCHHCDTPACYEAEHLWQGTRAQNIRDAANKGRLNTWGDTNRKKTHCPRGHEYTKENTGIDRASRYCRECKRVQKRERRVLLKGTR